MPNATAEYVRAKSNLLKTGGTMSQTTHISSWLIIGAGALLLGSALAMTAPLDPYKGWKRFQKSMKRTARAVSFLGSLAVLGGTLENLVAAKEHTTALVALGTLALVALAMALLLLVAGVVWLRRCWKTLRPRLADLARRVVGAAP